MNTQTKPWFDWYPQLLKKLLQIQSKSELGRLGKVLGIRPDRFDYTYCCIISTIHCNCGPQKRRDRIEKLIDFLGSKPKADLLQTNFDGIAHAHNGRLKFCDPKNNHVVNNLCRFASQIKNKTDRTNLTQVLEKEIDRVVNDGYTTVNAISKVLFILNPSVFIPFNSLVLKYVAEKYQIRVGSSKKAKKYLRFLDELDKKMLPDDSYQQISYQAYMSNESSSGEAIKNNKKVGSETKITFTARLSKKNQEPCVSKPFTEGKQKLRFSYQYERNSRIRKQFLKQLNEKSRYRCAVCGFSFLEKYGELALNDNDQEFIEVHHKVPISIRKQEYEVKDLMKEFVCLCPNCHQMIHRYLNNLIDEGEMKQEKYESQIEDFKNFLKTKRTN